MERHTVSPAEIARRKKAFTALVVCVFAGSVLSSPDLILANVLPAVALLFMFAILLYSVSRMTFSSLDGYSRIVITIDTHSMERISTNSTERFSLKDIGRISIKRTTRNAIREITITFTSGRGSHIRRRKISSPGL